MYFYRVRVKGFPTQPSFTMRVCGDVHSRAGKPPIVAVSVGLKYYHTGNYRF